MTSAEQLELIGTGAEQARLDALLDDGRAGRSGGLALRGEPGVGKTRLTCQLDGDRSTLDTPATREVS
jgi:hypothetical protein